MQSFNLRYCLKDLNKDFWTKTVLVEGHVFDKDNMKTLQHRAQALSI